MKWVKFRILFSVLFIGAIFQSIICILQFYELAAPFNKYFSITGTFENPNITAMFIAANIPFGLFKVKKKRRVVATATVILMVIALILLKCRTAYLGTAAIFIVFIFSLSQIQEFKMKMPLVIKIIGIMAVVAAIGMSFSFLYNYKKDSADGRMFIWKISSQMIAEKPFKGYGYGMFEKHYNLHQSKYFETRNGSDTEKANAGHVNMAYSEVIEQTVQGGIIATIIYSIFYGVMIYGAARQREYESLAVAISFFVMGFTNFTIQAIPLWIVLLVYASSMKGNVKYVLKPSNLRKVIIGGMLMVSSLLVFAQFRLLKSQIFLNEAIGYIKEGKTDSALNILEKNRKFAGTSEAYLRTVGKVYMQKRDFESGSLALEEAAKYSSLPDIYFSLADCSLYKGEVEIAENQLKIISYMIPTNLRSRYRLMILYNQSHQTEKAISMAKEIINIQPKTENDESNFYKEKAVEFLSEYI